MCGQEKRKKIFIFTANGVLIGVVLFLIFLRVYKVKITFKCDYGTEQTALVNIIANNFKEDYGESKNVQGKLICIFNKLPYASHLDNIDKIYTFYQDKLNCYVLFTTKFRMEIPVSFPYQFLTRCRFSCENENYQYKENFYLLMIGNRLVYCGTDFNFLEMNFIVKKNIDKDFTLAGSQMSMDMLKVNVIKRMNEKGLELLNVITNKTESFETFSDFSEIYFFHVNCSGCQLKTILNSLKLKKIIAEEKILIIFSIFANRFDLKSIMEQEGIELPVYIASKDEFILHSKITDDKENPLIIKGEELKK